MLVAIQSYQASTDNIKWEIKDLSEIQIENIQMCGMKVFALVELYQK